MLNDQVSVRVRVALCIRHMTGKDLADRLGITRVTLSKKLNGKSSFTIDEIERIQKITKTKILEVIHE